MKARQLILLISIVILLISIGFLLGSRMADLQPVLIKKHGIEEKNAEKGKEILSKAWKTQGLNYLKSHQTYSFTATDSWKGMMGGIGKPWPEKQIEIQFKYEVGTFNGQLTFLSGKRKGEIAGLQSWKYYEKNNHDLKFIQTDKKIAFGLSAFQYFFELADRLRKAPIISFAGTKSFNDNNYNLVFVTWGKTAPHKEHDQYVLWINQKTEMLEYVEFTIRDYYLKMPGSGALYGSVKYDDFKQIDGVLIPHKQTFFMNSPKKKNRKYLHELIVTDFKFDAFAVEELYPNPNLKKLGDEKLQVTKKY